MLAQLKILYPDSGLSDDALTAFLTMSQTDALKRYSPFDTTITTVPSTYDYTIIRLAISRIARLGAEGESSHNENGVNRVYEGDNAILSEITPLASVPSEPEA